MPFERINLRNLGPPSPADINSELKWLGAVLGLFGERDRDSSCFRIFVTIVRAQQTGKELSSDELASSCELSRGTVVHHLNKLRDSGLIMPSERGYALSEESIHEAIASLDQEMQRLMELTRAVAKDVDRKLRL